MHVGCCQFIQTERKLIFEILNEYSALVRRCLEKTGKYSLILSNDENRLLKELVELLGNIETSKHSPSLRKVKNTPP